MNIIDACTLSKKRTAVDKSHLDRIAFHCMAVTQTLLTRLARSVRFFVWRWEGACLLKIQVLICGLFLRTMVRFGPELSNLLVSRTTSVRYPTSQDFFPLPPPPFLNIYFHHIKHANNNGKINIDKYMYTVTIKYESS